MTTQEERNRIIEAVLRILYDNQVNAWTVQDKGILVAAVKLQLEEKPIGPIQAMLDMTVGNR